MNMYDAILVPKGPRLGSLKALSYSPFVTGGALPPKLFSQFLFTVSTGDSLVPFLFLILRILVLR